MSSTNKFDPEKINLSMCVPPCSLSDLHPRLIDMLRSAQALCGFSFRFSSGYRSKAHEFSRGRNGSSSHSKTPCLAVDILVSDSHARFKVLASLLSVGFDRIGIGKGFIHADIDHTKAHPIVWHYYD